FLSLSYFGTDQSQVQRYIGGASLREGRLGLMFNAVLKIPMQFVILLIGALLFVFYQFAPHPVFFNQAEWRRHAADGRFAALAAALSSKAAELAALGTTTTIDLWRHFRPLAAADEGRNVRVARRFTAMWGVVAVAFALFAGFAENLIEAINILGSIFYGVLLGLFVVAFFFRRVGGSAVFFAAVSAQALVIAMYFSLSIGYLWYNLTGCAAGL